MGRGTTSVWLVLLLLCSLGPMPSSPNQTTTYLEETTTVSSASSLTVAFSNGPSQDDDVKGTFALTFSIGGTGTLDSLLVEISNDDTTWTTVINLTETPWMYPFDTTDYDNDSYVLKATGWDSDAEDHVIATSGSFNITNQVPVITTFTVLNPDAGTGASLSERAWFNIGTQQAISFRWGASDDDLKEASLTNVPGPGHRAVIQVHHSLTVGTGTVATWAKASGLLG